MPEPKTCEARRYSDQMHCARCNITWDMNDSDPPVCPLNTTERADGRGTLDNLLGMLRVGKP